MKKHLIFLNILLLLTCGCATVYNPATQRQEVVFIDTKSEVALGKMINGGVTKDHKLSKDPQFNQRVKAIGEKIAAVCDRKDLQYEFYVIEDKELNALSLPGGFVYINTGLLKKADDDELAGVMAHEIGHVVARHAVKQLQAALGFNIVMAIAFNKSSAVQAYQAVNIVYNLVSLGYSREDERQADKLAVMYTYKAKYNPRGMITIFAKLKEEEKENGTTNIPVFLRSHPAVEERIKNIEREIKEVEHLKAKDSPANVSHPSQTVSSSSSVVSGKDTVTKANIAPEGITRKMCPRCKRVFPATDNFCPFDGANLVY